MKGMFGFGKSKDDSEARQRALKMSQTAKRMNRERERELARQEAASQYDGLSLHRSRSHEPTRGSNSKKKKSTGYRHETSDRYGRKSGSQTDNRRDGTNTNTKPNKDGLYRGYSAPESKKDYAKLRQQPVFPDCEGMLTKRAVKSGTGWKRRHFELHDGVVTYYKQKGGSIRGQITLSTACDVGANESLGKSYCIELRTPLATLYLCADNVDAQHMWIHALRKSIHELRRMEEIRTMERRGGGATNKNNNTIDKRDQNKNKGRAGSQSSSYMAQKEPSQPKSQRHRDTGLLNVALDFGEREPSWMREHHYFEVSNTRFRLSKRYKLIKPIGQGAYGVVIACEDRLRGKLDSQLSSGSSGGSGNKGKKNSRTYGKVAVKKITSAFDDLVDAKRILREIRLLRHFNHENIIRVLDIPLPESKNFEDVYIVSELMETDLHRVIYSKQSLSDEHIQYFIYQMLRALKYMHSAGVLHRDLKPSNLLVNSNCDLKICDFGLARGVDGLDPSAKLTEYVVTRWYRAPEIMLSCKKYTSAVDVWATGCILAELLGRKPIFPGNDYIHQLEIIADQLGSAKKEDLHFVTSSRALRFMSRQPKKRRIPFGESYPKASKACVNLLTRMLEFDPAKRISVEDALAHPYLRDLHRPDDEPICSRRFNFEFEKEKLDKKKLQELMYEDACAFHPRTTTNTQKGSDGRWGSLYKK